MTVPAVFHDLVEVSLCELDDWDGGVGTLDNDSQIQGNGCLSITESTAGLKAIRYETVTQVDMTGKMIIGWLTFARLAMLEIASNGGLRLCAQDSTARNAEWYVGGSDTLASAGWTPYIVHCDITPDAYDSGFDKTAVVKIGYRVNLAIKGIIKWDAFRYGTSIGIKRGTSTPGEEADLGDIWTEENNINNKYGILTLFEGVYYLQGKLVIGSTTSGEDTYFKDSSKIVVFADRNVPTGFYEITIQGNATANTKVYFGSEVGGKGISGFTIKSAGASKFKFTATDTNITDLGVYGCSFFSADTIALPPNSATREVLSTNFETCAQVLASTCVVKYCNFISAPADAVLVSDDPHYVTNCNFISCVNGVELDTVGDGEYNFDALVFTETTYDVNNTSGSALTVANGNGADADTYTGSTVSFIGSVTLKMVVKDEAGDVIVGARAYIDNNNESPYILDTTTDGSGEASVLYTGSPVTNATWRVRQYGYLPFEQLVNIGSEDITLPVTLMDDPIY